MTLSRYNVHLMYALLLWYCKFTLKTAHVEVVYAIWRSDGCHVSSLKENDLYAD